MKKQLLLFVLVLFAAGLQVSAQVNNEKDTDKVIPWTSPQVDTNLPSDFPVYENTGNATQDGINYDNAKRDWIKNNPEKYKEMNGGQVLIQDEKKEKVYSENESFRLGNTNIERQKIETIDKHLIDKVEFEKMPLEKQQHILANPDKYMIVGNQ